MNAYQPSAATDPVECFRPWEADDMKAARRRLLKARNMASARAVSCPSEAGREIFWLANEIAGAWVFAKRSTADLKNAANAIVRLFQAAATIEVAEAGDGD